MIGRRRRPAAAPGARLGALSEELAAVPPVLGVIPARLGRAAPLVPGALDSSAVVGASRPGPAAIAELTPGPAEATTVDRHDARPSRR